MMKAQQERLKRLLTDTVRMFVSDSEKYHSAVSVEGLIGITLDNEVFLVYVNESFTGIVRDIAANSNPCSVETSESLDIVWDECETSCSRNDQMSKMASDGPRDVDSGSLCANVTRISHDSDEEVGGEAKPLVIMSYWSEAPTQGRDYGSSHSKTASSRMTEENCSIELTVSASTSVLDNLLHIPTTGEKGSDAKNVMHKAVGLPGGHNIKQRVLFKDHDSLIASSGKCLTGSANMKLDQCRTSDDGLSTLRVNKEHACNICDKVFTQRRYLVRHKLVHLRNKYRKHTGTKYDQGCSQIAKQSFMQNMFNGELSADGRNACYCDNCGLGFQDKAHIIVHMRTHTGEKLKLRACVVCNRVFSHNISLTRHMCIHTGEKPYACKVCKRAFSRNSSLARHVHTHR